MDKRIKLRALFIGGCITLFFAVLVIRVFWIQVVQGSDWHKYAEKQWTSQNTISAVRGTITDRNGNKLAMDAPAYNVGLNPKVIAELGVKDEIVSRLHEILGTDESEIEKQATSMTTPTAKNPVSELRTWRELNSGGRRIPQDKADQVNALIAELKEKTGRRYDVGVQLDVTTKRYYPKNELASHVLGYTNNDGEAVAGIEAYYDKQLKGEDGSIVYQRDNQKDKLPDSQDVYKPAVNGSNLTLTIDETIQYYTEQAMKEAFKQLQPKSITVIAADPNTMDILAMANMPTFDPNKFNEVTEENYDSFKNLGIKAEYEPGSTFKIITLAGAVEEGLFNPEATYQSGTIQVGRTTLHDINRVGWGPITYLTGLKRSSNVAFVKLGYEMLGAERLRKYIDAFGFGVKTGVDLPGELSGAITFNPNIKTEVATAAYGHGRVQVTPLQQLVGVSAVANGGKVLTPHVVKSITDPNTGITTDVPVHEVRQAIDAATSEKVRGYLEQVVSDQEIGTGRHAYIDGYRVAGKTGTAVKVINGKYDYTKQVVSFIGFAPADKPKIAMIVVIDQPADSKLGGGAAAAPVFKKIVSQALPYMGVPKATDDSDTQKKTKAATSAPAPVSYNVPTLTGKTVDAAKKKLIASGITFKVVGTGNKVVKQYPAVGALMDGGQSVYLMTEDPTKMEIPDLKGESLRDALEILNLMKVEVTTVGQGYVAEQVESSANGRRIITLTLKSARAIVTGVDDEEANALGTKEATPAAGDDQTSNEAENKDSTDKTTEESTSSSETSADSAGTTSESIGPPSTDAGTNSTGSSTEETKSTSGSTLKIPEPTGAPTN
ncbi:penicillin-binding transpeptidase domain-containing protein [Paenibacillus bovis]|uniref:Stage V sporulation protein D n=1 Tax=Paenibacillus bovis TaxID=1616788 RepID=A0A172ZJ76_9BACL|nr:penicillin-binding transpeptidase domain-containing protein [Paenibacillus bovis]ANF97694.1 stage V sporulation protein D [Paenibacillus bovis]